MKSKITKLAGGLTRRLLARSFTLRSHAKAYLDTREQVPSNCETMGYDAGGDTLQMLDLPLPNQTLIKYCWIKPDYIGSQFAKYGLTEWESESLPIFFHLAETSRCTIDIGANTGVYSLLACAANPTSQVIAFEPQPAMFNRLMLNLAVNNWMERCRFLPYAISDRAAQLPFHIPDDDKSMASLNPEGYRKMAGKIIDVSTARLDDLCKELPFIDLVKVDVEGQEDKVLLGMRDILKRHRPTLVIECNPDGPIEAICSLLGEQAYEFYHLTEKGPERRSSIVPDQQENYRNYVCVGLNDSHRKLLERESSSDS